MNDLNNYDEYSNFYKKDVENIELFFLYVNSANEIELVNKIDYLLTNKKKIPKKNIIKIVKDNEFKNNKKYKLSHIIKYNLTIDPEDIVHMLEADNKEGYNFISNESYRNDIYFSDSIRMLEDINSLYIIFTEAVQNNNKSRKIKYTSNKLDKTRRKRI
tara:strand:+ start:5406 stop:5882 length:477 start_codon:yes stop_codon:yes gene_type:complete